jgi:hypothetical protein
VSPQVEPVRRVLKHFSPVEDGESLVWGSKEVLRHSVPAGDLPIPQIVQFILVQVVGCHDLGRSEKTAWETAFEYQGIRCALALQKFGLHLYLKNGRTLSGEDVDRLAAEIIGKLDKAVRVLERVWLRSFAEKELAQGNVTIRNQWAGLRSAYEYFREGAQLAFDGQGRRKSRTTTGPLR